MKQCSQDKKLKTQPEVILKFQLETILSGGQHPYLFIPVIQKLKAPT